MANITLDALEKAFKAEGIEVDPAALRRAYRRIAQPEGCEHCGQHVKVASAKEGEIRTNCCGALVSTYSEDEEPEQPRTKRPYNRKAK